MKKMTLSALVPNEGARRLAWWLGDQRCPDAFGAFARRLRTDVSIIDRLLSGELEPGSEQAFAISVVTGRYVLSVDWRREAEGPWGQRPIERHAVRAA